MDITERLNAFAMLGAGWVMWLLVGLSIIGLAIVLERAYYLLTSREDHDRLREDLRQLLGTGDMEAAQRRLDSSRSFEALIVRAGLEAREQGPAAAEERIAAETAIAKQRLERNLAFLGTVGNNAPFVGLLGTVIGIIRSFHALDESAGQVTSGLMTEIGEALVATAIGLLVALPAVAFFNVFQRIVRGRLAWADALGRELLAFLKAEPPAPAPAPAAAAKAPEPEPAE